MKQSRKRAKDVSKTKNARYAARQYTDYALAMMMRDDLKVMAYSALNGKDFEITYSKENTNFGVANEPKNYHWFCYVNDDCYMFFGNTEIELYCNIISSIVGNQLYYPFTNTLKGGQKDGSKD